MKIFVLGKTGSITHWLEDCVAAWRADGHQVAHGVTRNPVLHPSLARALQSVTAARVAGQVRRFAPDLIVAIGAFHVPRTILAAVADLPARPPLIGWVGDRFEPAASSLAARFDAVAYTDSGLVAEHRRLEFATQAFYLPHAVNPHNRGRTGPMTRNAQMVFVGNPTPHRRALVSALSASVSLYGPGWSRTEVGLHEIHKGRLAAADLAGVYGRHLAALNIRNEVNVLSGLNQRNFQPCLAGTPVITEAQADLQLCFDPGVETLVYQDAGELNSAYQRLRDDPMAARLIGEAGRRRVLGDHTYAHRLQRLLEIV